MAITTDAAIKELGTPVTAISDAVTITAGSFSAGTVLPVTPFITDVSNVTLARAVLTVTMAVSVTDQSAFHLYRRALNIEGVNDATIPSATYEEKYVGSFKIAPGTAAQYILASEVPLCEEQEFYVKNDTGQSTSGTTVLTVTPWTFNGKA